MKFVIVSVALLLLNTVYCRPSNDDDEYGFDVDEEDKDMQNDNYTDYDDGDIDIEEAADNLSEPKIETKGQIFIARENETVYLPCDISNANNFVTFWKKNNEIIFQDHVRFDNFGTNFQHFPNRTLVIKNVGANETGEYSCSLPLSEKEEVNVTHKLLVETSPTIVSLEAANNKTVYETGETLGLTCKASGYPEPKIIWSLKGKRLDVQGSSITIDNIGHHNAGEYQCLADNSIGKPAHKSIRINVVHAPTVKIEKLTVNSAENYESELICTVHAVPDAIVNWKKDGLNIKQDDRISIRHEDHTYVLKISKTQTSDFGVYTCSAVNRVGKTEKNVSLTGTPSPAQFLRGYEDQDMKSPVLTWTIESNSPITEHVLQFRKVGEGKWKTLKPEVTNPEGNIYTIKQSLPADLSQGQYEARVRSRNTYGMSEWSEIKQFNGVLAQRTHKHHLPPTTTYDLNRTGPETKSLENEVLKENIQEGARISSGAQSIAPLLVTSCVALAVLLASRR